MSSAAQVEETTMKWTMIALAAMSLAGCGDKGDDTGGPVGDATADAPYTLGAGDRMRIIVYGQDSLSNSYSVDGVGNISMPLIGVVQAHGLTTQALARTIEQRYGSRYLRDPKVSVEVEAHRPFFILGEVATPGQYPYVNGMTVQTAVAIAGGFSPRAAKSYAVVTRTINGCTGNSKTAIEEPVRPGDTITIRERFF